MKESIGGDVEALTIRRIGRSGVGAPQRKTMIFLAEWRITKGISLVQVILGYQN